MFLDIAKNSSTIEYLLLLVDEVADVGDAEE